MNWSIQLSDSQKYVKLTCEGFFTVADFLKMEEEFLARPFWQPGLGLLIDYRLTNFSGLKMEDLRFLEKKHIADKDRVGGGKMAFLVDSIRDFGLARQYELMTETNVDSKMMVFRDEAQAVEWLEFEDR